MKLIQCFNIDDKLRTNIRDHHYIDESTIIDQLLPLAKLDALPQCRVNSKALELAAQLRHMAQNSGHIQNLLNQYSLSTEEGVMLMCLAEALLRVPDKTTADRLIRDKLAFGDWHAHIGISDSFFVNASAWGLLLSGTVVSFNQEEKRLHLNNLQKALGTLGEPVIRQAMRQAMGTMGTQFVLGRTIEEASKKAACHEALGYCYSYDMLGEGARSMEDADAYFETYKNAIEQLGVIAQERGVSDAPSISVKLSAIHPRYEFTKYERLKKELIPRLKVLALMAKDRSLGLTIDAEEASRLDVSLDIIEQVFCCPDLDGWEGFGFAVQAYQKRALPVLRWAINLAKQEGRKLNIRLVKGAYWDSEIKIAQLGGMDSYPVFTRKASTDTSYQVCAGLLLDNRDCIFPQFATHNAYSVAYILERAKDDLSGIEFQRLHGMGEGLYEKLVEERMIPVRIYAPVGWHENLLAYLVRRLLENGANSSFVNNIVDESISLDSLVEDPVGKIISCKMKANPKIPLPKNIYGKQRPNSSGIDVTDISRLIPLEAHFEQWEKERSRRETNSSSSEIFSSNPANITDVLGSVTKTPTEEFSNALERADSAYKIWSNLDVEKRAQILLQMANVLEHNMDELIVLCVKEAGKTVSDGIAEVREAVDFCRYYANESRNVCSPDRDWGDDGQLYSRGIAVCISPWNFPLAIFIGQITAAIAVGNVVIAKPADSTCLIASRALELMMESGLPENVVQLIFAEGPVFGEHLLADSRVAIVMFTGSTSVGKWISRKLAKRAGPRPTLIAETGGQNCMIVDSTALPEQVVDDVISSAFQSAGQRCSALRVLYLQEEVADKILIMLIGAMKELCIGDPANLHTDIGPVIDKKALYSLNAHVGYMQKKGRLLYQCKLDPECELGTFFAPRLYEIENISVLKNEVFGPVLHVVRYRADHFDLVLEEINSTGFGLTAGVHSRIQATGEKVVQSMSAGNIYINRNTVGAVVGVQPFGGHGLSGTGPKAGGPSYLYRISQQKVSHRDDIYTLTFNFNNSHCRPSTVNIFKVLEVDIANHAKAVCHFVSSLYVQGATPLPRKLNDQIQLMANEAVGRQCKPKILRGPTGELNQLVVEPRGQLLCIQQGNDQIENSIRQLAAAMLYGNRVIHIGTYNADFELLIERAGLSNFYQSLSINSREELSSLVVSPLIQGIAVSGSEPLLQWLDEILATRDGALLPLIAETIGPGLSHRFFLEKVSSNNITASGGNATLLAM